jgi:uncharacterized membrane protein YdfJ with MMPL/SSD domain
MVEPTCKSLRERLNISRLAIAHPWLTVSFWLAAIVASSDLAQVLSGKNEIVNQDSEYNLGHSY